MGVVISLPRAVSEIIEVLEGAGYEAYAVGGCVRDSLLGRQPEDWDITTSANPQDIKRLFPRTVDTGIAHGTVTVMKDHVGYEVTTYRLDGEYEDHRHPKSVTFTKELAEDLRRRDFTINAMAYCERDGLIDLFDGQKHLEEGVIACVGDPNERFSEDALRILRGVRFSAQLNFAIEAETLAAMRRLAPDLRRVSAERIRTELSKLLLSDWPDRLLVLQETGISGIVLPEWDAMLATPQHNRYHSYNVGIHTLKAMETVKQLEYYRTLDKKQKLMLMYALLLHDVAKPLCRTTEACGKDHFYGHQKMSAEMAKDILQRLHFDNETIEVVSVLIRHHDSRYTVGLEHGWAGLRRLINRVGVERMPLLFALQRGDIGGHNPELVAGMYPMVDAMEDAYRQVVARQECISLKQLAVGGKELMALGIPSGPVIGELLKGLLEHVWQQPEANTRECLLPMAQKQWEALQNGGAEAEQQ